IARSVVRTFLNVPLQPPDTPVPDMVRILALRAGTMNSVVPPPAAGSGSCRTLGAGDHCDLLISGDTEVSATDPILVGHFLLSAGSFSLGDPSLSLVAPVEQFRKSYTFLVPQQYTLNYVSVVAPVGSEAKLDGRDVSSPFPPFGLGQYGALRVGVTPGPHRVE